MVVFFDQDDPEIHRDSNPQEESTNPELRDDVATQESHVQNSEELRQIVSAPPASCSAINEANTITDSSPSSSRNVESSVPDETRSATEEEDRNYDGDHDEDEPKSDDVTSTLVTQPPEENVGFGSLVTTLPPQENVGIGSFALPRNTVGQLFTQRRGGNFGYNFLDDLATLPRGDMNLFSGVDFFPRIQVMMPRGENAGLGRLVTQPSHQNPRVNQIARSDQTMNRHQQFTRPILGSSLYASGDHTNFRQSFGRQRQLSLSAAPWRPRNTYQQNPVANQIPNLAPMRPQRFTRGPGIVYYIYAPCNPDVSPVGIQMPRPSRMYIPLHVLQRWRMWPILAAGPVLLTHELLTQILPNGQRRTIALFYDHSSSQLQVVYNLETGERSTLAPGDVLRVLTQTQQLIEFRGTDFEASTEQGRDQQQPR